jgi:hypothetical chaperone protein
MIIGMDFGTTNSGMAVYDGRDVSVLPLDPAGPNPRVCRTALYITNEQAVIIGREALDRYLEHNLGRPVKLQKVWVGELEVIADRVYYITDVFVFTDVLSPGRLFLSIKTGLRDENYPGTVIGQFYYSLESLIALFLSVTRARAERLLGRELRQVVLGRPVHFATDAQHDRIAEARLLQAAFRAGYETVYLQPEPIAAALSYELTLDRPQNVLVFDFGGGTLDITVMRLGEHPRRILATGGVPIAGDVFDAKLSRAKLPRHFGEGSYYGPRHKALTVPSWIYDTFGDWQSLLELQTSENRQLLREIAQTAQRKHQIEALIALAQSNYGLKLFDTVETAKRTLSDKRGTELYLDGPGFSVREFVTRGEFEGIIAAEIKTIERAVEETLASSGLRPEQIDSVIRTGGSALIPAFHEMLVRRFGPEKVHSIDAFSSVTAGLGVTAHHVERGEMALPAHTPEEFSLAAVEATGGRLKLKPVNLDLLQRRIRLEEAGEGGASADAVALVLLGRPAEDELGQTSLGAVLLPDVAAVTASGPALTGAVRQAQIARPDDQLLLVTTRYRFLLVSARQLADLEQVSVTARDLFQLAPRESISAVAAWSAIRGRERLLLVTSTGFVRAYPMDVLRGSIEAPTPYRFDSPLPGVVVAALGADRDEEVALLTESGRGLRWPLARLPMIGLQLVHPGKADRVDRVAGALAGKNGSQAVVVLADGYARRLALESIPVPPGAKDRGRTLVTRQSPAVGLVAAGMTLVVTDRRRLTADGGSLPLEASTKATRWLKLEAGESVSAAAAL